MRERASARQVALALSVFSLYSVLFFRYGPPHQVAKEIGPTLEAAFGYSPSEANQFFAAIGEHGRALFAHSLRWDLLYPLFFAPPLAFVVAVSLGRALGAWRAAYALGAVVLLGGIADWVENAALLALIASFPEPRPAIAAIASAATEVKISVVLLTMALMPVTVTFWYLRYASERARRAQPPAK